MSKVLHKRPAQAIAVAVLLLLAYGSASWAIDNGSILLYIVTFTAIWFAVTFAVRAIRGKKK